MQACRQTFLTRCCFAVGVEFDALENIFGAAGSFLIAAYVGEVKLKAQLLHNTGRRVWCEIEKRVQTVSVCLIPEGAQGLRIKFTVSMQFSSDCTCCTRLRLHRRTDRQQAVSQQTTIVTFCI